MSNNQLTIQQLTDQLEELLAWFESEEITVEESVKKYEIAAKISAEIEERLATAKNQITVIKKEYSDV